VGTVVEFPPGEREARTEKKIGEWVCPACGQELMLSEFKSKRGFLLVCKGSDTIPHRLRIYLENFSKEASFLPGSSSSKKARIQQLLAKAAGEK